MVLAPHATADPCSAVHVAFARGREEAPGLGRVGQAFVDALQRLVGNTSVYAVNYSAGLLSTGEGATDLRNHLSEVADACPNTKFVIGGYSMGATVIDDVIGVTGGDNVLPPEVGDRVRAVATFGNITYRDGPLSQIGGAYASRSIDLCNANDPVCQSGGRSVQSHSNYEATDLPAQAARFAAARL